MGALKTEPSFAPVGEGRQKKPFLFSTVSLSLSLCRSIVPLSPSLSSSRSLFLPRDVPSPSLDEL